MSRHDPAASLQDMLDYAHKAVRFWRQRGHSIFGPHLWTQHLWTFKAAGLE